MYDRRAAQERVHLVTRPASQLSHLAHLGVLRSACGALHLLSGRTKKEFGAHYSVLSSNTVSKYSLLSSRRSDTQFPSQWCYPLPRQGKTAVVTLPVCGLISVSTGIDYNTSRTQPRIFFLSGPCHKPYLRNFF